jgi:hypothetical protein
MFMVFLLAGCDKKADEGKQESAPAAGKPESRPASAGPFADFDMDAIKAKMKGVWVVGGSVIGTREAWDVQGSEVTVFNGSTEEKHQLELIAPCRGKISQTESGATSSTYFTFAFDGNDLYSGLGYAGVKQGDSLVACVSADIYTLKGGKCTRWKESVFGDKMESSDAECSLADDVFKVKTTTGESELKVKGNVLLNQQMEGNRAVKASDLADAKAKLGKK